MVKLELKFANLKVRLNIPFTTAIVILFQLGKNDIIKEVEELGGNK